LINILTFSSNPDLVSYADASGHGWCAKIEAGDSTSGILSQFESTKHINYLELLAVKLALISLLNDRLNIHIRIMSDNTTVVSYINAMGGCKSLDCNSLACDIWDWAIARGIWLSSAHIPGKENVDADTLSRGLNANLEWMFSFRVFQKIVSIFGQASRLNAQVDNYISWKPDPGTSYVDAFSVDWSKFAFYAFPPFCLVSRCIQKIVQDQATGILVIPLWITQPFFIAASSLSVDKPRIVRAMGHNLTHPTLKGPHPLHQKLEFLVCRLSGNLCWTADITEVLMSSWRDSTHKQYTVYINKWVQFCCERSFDPLHSTLVPLLEFLHYLFG
jgi:hypothetical protein